RDKAPGRRKFPRQNQTRLRAVRGVVPHDVQRVFAARRGLKKRIPAAIRLPLMPAERSRSITENRIEGKEAWISLSGRLLREEWRGDQQREQNYGYASDSIHGFFLFRVSSSAERE